MLTLALYVLLAIAVMAAVFFVVASLLPAGEQIAPAVRDERLWELPVERHIVAEDVTAVRLPVALRGYRFAEADLLLDRLAEELRSRDRLIAQLRGHSDESPPEPPEPPETPPETSETPPEPPETSDEPSADEDPDGR
jgi:DivIVA domain-containing protein